MQESAKPQKPQEAPKLTAKQLEQVRGAMAERELRGLMKSPEEWRQESNRSSKKGLFYDPRAIDIVPKTGTGISTQGAVEGAGQMILSAQLSSVRNYELTKAVNAWDALQTDIARLRSSGFDVTVTVVAQVPKQPDVAAHVTGVGNAGEVVYFEKMYISRFTRARPNIGMAPSDAPTGMKEASAEDSALTDKYGTQDQYEQPGWIEAMQTTYEMYRRAGTYKPPRPGFRFEVRSLPLPAYQ
jgi:hypothetical protein